ncbi:MAG: nucleotide sugar dehydrogenase [Streptococcaceae bacterium]|nr:nucleotide sugar dehydrogenase [Streptococcaceae bacterium]
MNISVIGLGYVGLSNALLLAQHNEVTAFDINQKKITQLQKGLSPLEDVEIETFLVRDNLHISFETSFDKAVAGADLVIIATPTDFDETTQAFDTTSIEAVLAQLSAVKFDKTILIKSTIPLGYISKLPAALHPKQVLFSPEFLREGHALFDNLHPSRIIIGEESERARQIAILYADAAVKFDSTHIFLMGELEAEATKLFSNTYLALRVAYFNEIDSYALANGLDSRKIIAGMAQDPRIGDFYNNPSFGYGGYCLPKDTKEIESEYANVPQDLISAVVAANKTRKAFIADAILAKKPASIGIYRLTMKANSDNFRYSSILDILNILRTSGIPLTIYEPSLVTTDFQGIPLENNLETFAQKSALIVANRMSPELRPYAEKVFSRDLYGRD